MKPYLGDSRLALPGEHGYPNCDCDMEGGDPTCEIQPPYESPAEHMLKKLMIAEAALTLAANDMLIVQGFSTESTIPVAAYIDKWKEAAHAALYPAER